MTFRNLFSSKRKAERRGMKENECVCYGNGNLMFGGLGNNYSALNISTIFRCVSLISQTVAMLPIDVVDEDGKDVNHPISLVFKNKTGNVLNCYDMFKQAVHNILLQGNGYFYVERGSDGTAINLRYIPANDVTINYKKELNKVFYQCPYINHGSAINSNDMCHFKLYSYDGVQGISVLNYATRSIDVANRVENTAQQYYKNNGLISGILSYQGNMTQQQKQQIKADWDSTYGSGQSGIAIVAGGMSYTQIGSNAADTQINESRNYNVADLCRFFGVNPVLLGLNNGFTFGTIEMIQTEFLLHTIMPIVTMMEQELNKKIFGDSDVFKIDMNENSMLRADKDKQSSYYSQLLTNGVLTINEVREELGYSPVQGGDKNIIAYTDINQNTINNNKENNNE